MIFEPNKIAPGAFYAVMLQCIIPRPIAWVLSQNPNGTFNVAPFSFFNGVASEPPILMISVGWKDDTTRKDTWINIDERQEFVVHIPPGSQAQKMVATSAALPFENSEVEHANLKTIPVEGMKLPRVDGPKVAMFCQKHKIIEVGEEKQGLILGEIKQIWVDDSAVTTDNGRYYISPQKLDPLARLGGKDYSLLGDVFPVARP